MQKHPWHKTLLFKSYSCIANKTLGARCLLSVTQSAVLDAAWSFLWKGNKVLFLFFSCTLACVRVPSRSRKHFFCLQSRNNIWIKKKLSLQSLHLETCTPCVSFMTLHGYRSPRPYTHDVLRGATTGRKLETLRFRHVLNMKSKQICWKFVLEKPLLFSQMTLEKNIC